MDLLDQAPSVRTAVAPTAIPAADGVSQGRPAPQRPAPRVNWLFSGVLLGAAGWFFPLAVIFAALGRWTVSAGLLGGLALCLLGMWRASRRLRRVQRTTGH